MVITAAKENWKRAEAIPTARNEASLTTRRRPSWICRHTRACPAGGLGIDSGRRIRRIDRTDRVKEKTLARMAIGAVTSDTRAPPIAGPAICAADLLASSALVPWASWSRFTSRTREV